MLLASVGSFSTRTFAGLCLLLCGGCQVDPDGFTEQDRELIRAMALTQVPPPDGNEYLEAPGVADFGQALFFDPDLSGTLVAASQGGQPDSLVGKDGGLVGRVSCADCHAPRASFGDDRSPNNVSLGLDFTARNSPSLVNVAFYRWFGWDGRSDSLWMQCGTAHEAAKTMAGTRLRLARLVASRYADLYGPLFGDAGVERLAKPAPGLDSEFELGDGGVPVLDAGTARFLNRIAANSYKAMAAYLTELSSADAGIDAFARGDETALSPAAKRGLKLFLGRAGCIECHHGSRFTDDSFHQIGIGQRGDHVPAIDDGRVTGQRLLVSGGQSVFNGNGEFSSVQKWTPADLKPDQGTPVFRTKSLRNVAESPPYMHAGQLQSLEDVVAFYNSGGESAGFSGAKDLRIVPLGLTGPESADLVEFLHALTGGPVPAARTCDRSRRANPDPSAHRFGVCP